jgi:hypothetical protein
MFDRYQGTLWRDGACIQGTKDEYTELTKQANAAAVLQDALIPLLFEME